MHQTQRAGRAGRPARASRRATTSRRSSTATGNNFPYTFFGLEPGTTKDDVRRCLERWNEGDNGILDLSKAYRLKPGTGWLVPPVRPARPRLARDLRAAVGLRRLRHVPVDGRRPARALGAAGQGRARGEAPGPRLPRRAARLGDERRPDFKDNHYLEPIVRAGGDGRAATSTSGSSTARSTASSSSRAKELTVQPGAQVTIKDNGRLRPDRRPGPRHDRQARRRQPGYIRFGELTEDEVFVTEKRAKAGVTFENTGTEAFVSLRYFGPDVHPNVPEVGSAPRTPRPCLRMHEALAGAGLKPALRPLIASPGRV